MDALRETLLALDQAGWQALVDGRGRAYYRDLLADDAVVIGLGSATGVGSDALDRLSGQTWAWFRLRSPRAMALGDGGGAVTYRVVARRDFDTEHQALVTSTYRRDGDGWRLVLHQQTPI